MSANPYLTDHMEDYPWLHDRTEDAGAPTCKHEECGNEVKDDGEICMECQVSAAENAPTEAECAALHNAIKNEQLGIW